MLRVPGVPGVELRASPGRHESAPFLPGSGPCAGAVKELFFYTRDHRRGELVNFGCDDLMVTIDVITFDFW